MFRKSARYTGGGSLDVGAGADLEHERDQVDRAWGGGGRDHELLAVAGAERTALRSRHDC